MPNLGQLAALTMQNYRKTLADNVTRQCVVTNIMEEHDMITTEDGGREIVVPVLTGLSTSVSTYSGTSPVNNPYQEGIDAAQFTWAHYESGVALSKTDELLNSGEFAVKKLLKAKIQQAEQSLKERLNDDIFNGAGTSGTPAAEIVGLQTLVANT
ncbi:MAG: phage major capsid protein, partial [bacterium]|nr:phage major capsid protein [bacterium]